MPQIKSAKKRVRVTARQTAENRLHRTRSRTALKKVRTLVAAGEMKEATVAFTTAQKYLDKASKTNAVHPNAARRAKSRLAAVLKAAGNKDPLPAAAAAATKKTARKAGTKKPAPKAKSSPKPAVTKAKPAKTPAKASSRRAAKPRATTSKK